MASKRRVRRRACERKNKYTKDEAFAVARRLRQGQMAGRRTVDAYPCDLCGQWHVGHRPKKEQQRISARRKAAG